MDIDKETQQANLETGRKKRPLFEIFPREYDFESMLAHQSEMTVSGVQAFLVWLETREPADASELARIETMVDGMRHDLEEKSDTVVLNAV